MLGSIISTPPSKKITITSSPRSKLLAERTVLEMAADCLSRMLQGTVEQKDEIKIEREEREDEVATVDCSTFARASSISLDSEDEICPPTPPPRIFHNVETVGRRRCSIFSVADRWNIPIADAAELMIVFETSQSK